VLGKEVGEVVEASVWWPRLLLPEVCELKGVALLAVQVGGEEAGGEGGGEGQL